METEQNFGISRSGLITHKPVNPRNGGGRELWKEGLDYLLQVLMTLQVPSKQSLHRAT